MTSQSATEWIHSCNSKPTAHSTGKIPKSRISECRDARLRLHINENSDCVRVLRLRLLEPEQRPVDRYGTITQAQAADLIIRPDMNEYETEHAYDLDPCHPLVHLALECERAETLMP